jgi:hypothetical protein
VGLWSQTTTETINEEPTVFRFNAAALGLAEIDIKITGDNASGAAPVVHGLDIGFNTRALQGADN